MISIVKDLKESTALPKEWQGFKPGAWTESIDVRDFIQHNYTPYSGNEEFLSGPSQRTLRLWDELKVLLKREIDNGGVLDADEEVVSSITSHKPGYIDKELEVVVGLQTDAPLKRALMPFGGLRMAQQALESYGFKMCEKTADIFKKIRKTHNEGVFDAYTSDIRAARSAGIITGLPDAYGRGRIIGDYRRVALYGTDRLIAERRKDLKNREHSPLTDELIRLREEMSEQIRALEELAQLGASYGCDSPRRKRPRSRAMDVPGLPGRREGTERSGHVPGPRFHFLRHLFHPRPGTGAHHGRGSSGNHRPVRDEAAHRPFHPHA